MGDLTDLVADHYLGKQRTELDWIRNALRNWNISTGPQPQGSAREMDLVLKHWVSNQHQYFKGCPDKGNVEFYERIVDFLMFAGVLIAFLWTALLLWAAIVHRDVENAGLHGFGVVALSLLLIGAGLFHHYAEKMAFAEHAKQYDRMRSLFGYSMKLLQRAIDAQDLAQAQRLVRDLGIAALQENGDWVLLHRERPLEVPHAG